MDDHRQVLDRVAAMLSSDFEVAGLATDGAQAVEQAGHLNPDVIVMDVEMPGLDGLQTLRALERHDIPTPPVVFLSMHDADDIVDEAFRRGAHGYVLKQRVGRDLAAALDQALCGRRFVPSLAPLVSDGHCHAMVLYDGVDGFVGTMATALDLGLRRGDATCLIGTPAVRENIADRLRALGWDLDESGRHERYRPFDAAEALKGFIRDGMPDQGCLSQMIKGLDEYRAKVSKGTGSRLTVVGNLSASLASAGNTRAALAAEQIWNRETADLPFLTVCGYASSCFHDGAPDLWPGICREHQALSHAKDV